MRQISDVIARVLALFPVPVPPAISDDLAVLGAELAILLRTAAYTPAESPVSAELWSRLGTACYRYLPSPASYPFAQAISDLLMGPEGDELPW
jgi:hypothetical protein